MNEFFEKLKNPSKEYRGVPFWSWNDKLEPEMLRWQIREMDKAGLGGYFMHARGGLQTEYLSEEWMECIKACIDEGNKLGMNSWCYDEEGWPSGFAGGIVTAMDEKFHMRWLEIEQAGNRLEAEDDNVLGIYRLDTESGKLARIEIETGFEHGSEKGRLLLIKHKSNPYYIDILNEEVVKAFIEVTHEKYYEKFKDEFGKGMPGFFTDEPQYSREKIPWSHIVPEKFLEKNGYDIRDVLPALFIECEGYEKVRYDYWALMNELYVKSFGKQIYDWCDEHNCRLTGHSIQEDSMFDQMWCSAGVMTFYEYMHIPGIDWLCRRISSPVVPKQVGSAANQLGKKFVLTETFALCGWDVSFEELKWMGEWQYVNGVNLMCQHLEGYTLRGLRKRDYPPSLFYQQSWWDEYRFFNDYFARLGMLLSEGRNVADVLLLHPMKSAWIAYDNTNNDAMKKLDYEFIKATELLSGLHLDHHYGDETLIGKYGKVECGKFIIGECEYKVVVLPSMLTIDQNTLNLLNEFIDDGGKVISMGNFPELCSGAPCEKTGVLRQKVEHLHGERDKLYRSVKQAFVPPVSISDGSGEIEAIHYQQRDMGSIQAFFMVNHDTEKAFDAVVTINGKGRVKRLLVENGEIENIDFAHEEDSTVVNIKFLPMQSYVLLFDTAGAEQAASDRKETVKIRPGKVWEVQDMDLNSMTLDYCLYNIDNSGWNGPVHTINLMDMLLNLRKNCDIALKFNFEVGMDLEKNRELFLAVENAGEFDICVNGEDIAYKDIGWWKDSSFKKVDIRKFVKNGSNEVILRRRFYQSKKVYDVLFGENVLETEINKLTYDVELESIYVVGDFGVVSKSEYTYGERKAVFNRGPFVIVDRPGKIWSGDLTQQGFCFFAGAVKLCQSMQVNKKENTAIILDIGKPDAVISKVFVNNKEVKILPWAPYEADITEAAVDGENRITVELFAGNRNLLGPHHHVGGELYAVGPASFTGKAGWEGNTGETIWTDRYCFVKFGLE